MSAVRGDEMALLRAVFDDSGHGLEEYRRRLARERRREWLRSWRPRFRISVRIRLFPKTQNRLNAMERELHAARTRISVLESRVSDLFAEQKKQREKAA